MEDEGVGVEGEKDFGVVVADLAQRSELALERRFIARGGATWK